jgi:hypothetical protein
MRIWQADFYRHPQKDATWYLLICDETRSLEHEVTVPQSQANSSWIATEIQQLGILPDIIQVFRPQSLSLIEQAGRSLGVKVETSRRTLALKQWLEEKHYPIAVDRPPPIPLPENLWGKEWRFGTIPAKDVVDMFSDRPIPILSIPEYLQPLHLGLASNIPIPGIVIYGGRQSMRLARWLEEVSPVSLSYIAGAPDGLVLESGLIDRWVVVTFDDSEVANAAKVYEQRKQESQGLHFLLVQPDDSEMTYSGFWLLQAC